MSRTTLHATKRSPLSHRTILAESYSVQIICRRASNFASFSAQPAFSIREVMYFHGANPPSTRISIQLVAELE
jgi:hypothetical protein